MRYFKYLNKAIIICITCTGIFSKPEQIFRLLNIHSNYSTDTLYSVDRVDNIDKVRQKICPFSKNDYFNIDKTNKIKDNHWLLSRLSYIYMYESFKTRICTTIFVESVVNKIKGVWSCIKPLYCRRSVVLYLTLVL